jgi:signal transduction histidine kinase
MMPGEDGSRAPVDRIAGRRETWLVVAGMMLLALAALLLLRNWGIWFSDAVVWPVILAAAGGALIWRQSQEGSDPLGPTADSPRPVRGSDPLTLPRVSLPRDAFGRVLVGAALVVGGALVFLWLNDALQPARDVLLAVVVVLVALTLILAPWWLRLVRGLSAERTERIRSQERAEVAAHLHDSVLQTLALMQKRASEPREVAALARRQERELRAWLNGRRAAGDATVALALEAVAAEVEEAHGVPVEVVAVGDAPLDERAQALVAAAREALVNAAKFAPGGPVALYAEVDAETIEVFVRDRGPGFDPAAVPDDRRGVRESIVGRMERHGGRAVVHSAPGAGTEVELVIRR